MDQVAFFLFSYISMFFYDVNGKLDIQTYKTSAKLWCWLKHS